MALLYDRILRHRKIIVNKSDTVWNWAFNTPCKSLEGILVLFEEEKSYTRDTSKFYNPKIQKVSHLLVARGLPRDTENIPVYWKNFTSGLSFTVSILGQHFWSALGSAFATSSSRHQGGSYNSKTSLSA